MSDRMPSALVLLQMGTPFPLVPSYSWADSAPQQTVQRIEWIASKQD